MGRRTLYQHSAQEGDGEALPSQTGSRCYQEKGVDVMEAKFYTYRVFWSEEDQEFVGLCSEFPGMSWLDEDPQQTFTGIMTLVQECINDLDG